MEFPPLPTSGPLNSTLEFLLEEEGVSSDAPLCVLNSTKLKKHLLLKGYQVVDTLSIPPSPPFGAIIAVNTLPKGSAPALTTLRRLMGATTGPLFVVESSSPLTGPRGRSTRLLSFLGFFHTPEALNTLFLQAGMVGISQRWPQGFRSLLITWGRPHPKASLLHPHPPSPSTL